MKLKPDKDRLKQIRKIYRSLGLESKEDRKYLAALASFPSQTEQKRPIVFIEAGITSCVQGELKNAGLESDPT